MGYPEEDIQKIKDDVFRQNDYNIFCISIMTCYDIIEDGQKKKQKQNKQTNKQK